MPIRFYTIDPDYCNFLRRSDPCIPLNSAGKSTRPFIGIVLTIGQFNYYAPLASPKTKHLQMKNQPDFIKINHGYWGVINLNNMIPVPLTCLSIINFNLTGTESVEERKYKMLLANQHQWCNAHKADIQNKAQKLYQLITTGRAPKNMLKRCCQFNRNEKQLIVYESLPPKLKKLRQRNATPLKDEFER